jgi:hypothetical protein
MTTGTVMVFITAEGRVLAHAACFEQARPGGYTVEQAQRLRCQHALHAAVFDALSSPVLVAATDEYDRAAVVSKLELNGCRTHCFSVEVPA